MHKLVIIAERSRASAALGTTLQLAGHETVHAHLGSVGLLLAQALKPDAVLLDASLSGLAAAPGLCRTLKSRSPGLPVLLVGGTPAQATRGLAQGASGWLPLPFEPWELLALVERHAAPALADL